MGSRWKGQPGVSSECRAVGVSRLEWRPGDTLGTVCLQLRPAGRRGLGVLQVWTSGVWGGWKLARPRLCGL